MNSSDDSKSEPAVLLLSEIDKLLARTRSMELQLEQARATAEEKNARLHDHVLQLEVIRRSNENEIDALRQQVANQEHALTGRDNALTAAELALHGKIQSLQGDLARRLGEIAERDSAIEILNSEAAALRARIAELESRIQESPGATRQDFEARLKTADEQLIAAQENARSSEKEFRAKVDELQIQLAGKQLLANRRGDEIEDLRAAVTRLSAQIAGQVPGQSRSTEEGAHKSRATHESKIAGTNEQEFAMKTGDQDGPLTGSAAEIGAPGSPQAAVEQSLRNEVNRLIREAQEKNQILQDRNDELVRVKAELDGLQERLQQLESSSTQAESALRDDSERMRTEFQAQLALLQAELSQREWAIEERQAEARGQEQKLREEIDSLREQLTAVEAAKQNDAGAFVFGEPREGDAREQHFDGGGAGNRIDSYAGSFARQRRWHSGFGWKRRWRS